mgnify:CR=1 FL=1
MTETRTVTPVKIPKINSHGIAWLLFRLRALREIELDTGRDCPGRFFSEFSNS